MGIPFYFRDIVQKDSRILRNDIKTCNNLYLDFNSIIHTCSNNVVTKNPTYTMQSIFDEIINHTMKLVDLCTPSDLLYIAVDGVAPRAKIQQQRRRRYISAYKNEAINQFKINNDMGVIHWDSNCITPGTVFMQDLNTFLQDYFKKNPKSYNVYISGHNEEGEGEHKIIWHIKNGNVGNDNDDKVNVIYGLDADLIMLSLSCRIQKIFLMREMQDFMANQVTFMFLDVDCLRKNVSKYLYNDENELYMYDYIFICFLLGNDFIPGINFLKIKNGAIDILCSVYKKVNERMKSSLVTKTNKGNWCINHDFLVQFLEALAKLEDNGMKDVIQQHDQFTFNPNRRFPNRLDKFIYELESYPIINKFPYLVKPHNDMNWRNSYYHYLFQNTSSEVIKQCSLNYLEGLLWTSNYYFNMIYDKNWYYKFDQSPCMTDLYKYVFTTNDIDAMQEKLKITHGCIIDAKMQMLMVLPPQSWKLLPDQHQCLMKDVSYGCLHYFPVKFKFSTFLKTQLWECIPILPDININHLITRMK